MNRNQYVTICARDAGYLYQLAQLGRQIADEQGYMLKVMLFAGLQRQCVENAMLLEYVFECAKNMDAEMRVYYTDQPMEKLMGDQSACLVVSGEEEMAGQIRRMMPERRLVVME